VEVPVEAFTRREGLRAALEPGVPQRLGFVIGTERIDGRYQDDRAQTVLIPDTPRAEVPVERLIGPAHRQDHRDLHRRISLRLTLAGRLGIGDAP
jgi:hypothetical protein